MNFGAHRVTCTLCQLADHDGMTCAEAGASAAMDDAPVLALAHQQRWRRCPMCR